MPQDNRLKLLLWSSVISIAFCTVIFTYRWTYNEWESYQQSAQQIAQDGHKRSLVDWQLTHLNAIHPHPSTVECTSPSTQPTTSNTNKNIDTVHQTCMFTNIVLYQGNLLFIAQDDDTAQTTTIPDPLVFEVGNSPSNDLSLPRIMSVTTADKLKTLIQSKLDSSSSSTDSSNGDSDSNRRRRLHGDTTSSDSTTTSSTHINGAAVDGGDQIPLFDSYNNNDNNDDTNNNKNALYMADFQIGIFQRTRTFNNWFWALNGAGNTFHRLCKYFDICTIKSIKESSVVLQPLIESSHNLSSIGYVGLPNHHAYAVHDLMSCFGPLLWVNHPSRNEVDTRPSNQIVFIRKMLVGIGDDVVQPKAALDAQSKVRFAQATPEMSLKRVKFLRQCAGLPEKPSTHTKPSILLVNRPYADGRSILSLDDVYDRLRRALPADVPVRIFLPRGSAGIKDQATAFDGANIVVAPHGAATANFNFLPYDAVALGVFALKGRFGHDEAVGASMPAPPYNITVLQVDCTERTEARTRALTEYVDFMNLAGADQAALILGQEMSIVRTRQVRELLDISLLDWMDYRSYNPDPIELTDKVLSAVKLWEAKVAARKRVVGAG